MDYMVLAGQFHDLFSGLDRAHGVYLINSQDGNKLRGKAETVIEPVTDSLWEKHLQGSLGIGIVPITDNATVHWAAIDIDVYEGLDIKELGDTVKSLGLPLVLCLTKSGGIHAYLFIDGWAPAKLVRKHMANWAQALGHSGAEVFPKQDRLASRTDVGNWINVPYFGNTRYSIRDGNPVQPEDFVAYAKSKAISVADLENFELVQSEDLKGAPPCIQCLAQKGVAKGEGRHNFLFDLAVYAKKRWPEEWQQHVRSFNRKYITPSLSARDVKTTVESVRRRKTYFFKCKDIPISTVCNKELCKDSEYGVGSSATGSALTNLRKHLTDPPVWYLEVGGVDVELQSTAQLYSQTQFCIRCMDAMNKVHLRVPEPDWLAVVQALLDNVTEIPAPVGSSDADQIWALIDRFCTDQFAGAHVEDLLNGNAYRDDTLIYFRPADLIRFLETERHAKVNKPVLWSQVKTQGGGSQTLTVKGKQVVCWTLTRGTFTEQTEDFEVRVKPSEF